MQKFLPYKATINNKTQNSNQQLVIDFTERAFYFMTSKLIDSVIVRCSLQRKKGLSFIIILILLIIIIISQYI